MNITKAGCVLALLLIAVPAFAEGGAGGEREAVGDAMTDDAVDGEGTTIGSSHGDRSSANVDREALGEAYSDEHRSDTTDDDEKAQRQPELGREALGQDYTQGHMKSDPETDAAGRSVRDE